MPLEFGGGHTTDDAFHDIVGNAGDDEAFGIGGIFQKFAENGIEDVVGRKAVLVDLIGMQFGGGSLGERCCKCCRGRRTR